MKTESIQDKRELMARESWIKNVMRVLNWTREQAEEAYTRIFKYYETI